VQYFLRRSELATPATFTMTPDTTRVLPQPDELAGAPTSCQSPVNDPGSVDGHRWQDFGILPDRWKDTAFGGPGMACMLYVNYDEGRGDEYAWVTAADLIGATQAIKFGAHNGWHINSLADDPNDPSNFVSTHGGQAGSIWDMYRVHGVDDPLRGFAGSIGSRASGSQPGDGTPWEMASNIGPYPSALPHSYHLIYFTTGDHEDIQFGPINDRGQNDVAVVEHYLTHPSTYSESMLFIQGSGFSHAENEAAAIYPYHSGFPSGYLATGLVNDDLYAQANVAPAPCLELVLHPTLAPPFGVTLGIDNPAGQTNDVLSSVPGLRPSSVTSEYDPTLGIDAPYRAGIFATETTALPFRTLVDGFALKHVVTSDCGSPVGRLSYLYDVFTTVFENCGDLPPVSVLPDEVSATSRNGVDLLDLPVRGAAIQIRLRLAQPDHVDAVLFDLGGREVGRVVSRDVPAGVHRLSWDASGPDGRRLSPGAYFLQVVFARQGFRTTRKVIILSD
jgi:flagellar hook capping protein FlgD